MGACSAIPATAAARAARAQARSVSASVRTWPCGAAATTSTRAPARRSAAAQFGVGRAQAGGRAERDEQDVDGGHAADRAMLPALVTGTLINVGAILLGTLLGTLVGDRLPERLRRRVLDGLGLVTLVIGVDLALAWRDTNVLYVLGGVLLGAIVGEALDIEGWLERIGDRLQTRVVAVPAAPPAA